MLQLLQLAREPSANLAPLLERIGLDQAIQRTLVLLLGGDLLAAALADRKSTRLNSSHRT